MLESSGYKITVIIVCLANFSKKYASVLLLQGKEIDNCSKDKKITFQYKKERSSERSLLFCFAIFFRKPMCRPDGAK